MQRKITDNLLIFLVFSSAVYYFSLITADPDLWGHIKFGEDLWLSKSFPWVDTYSFTAYGREWFNHEWLSELIMYLVFHFFGSSGLLIGKLFIGLSIVFLLFKICRYRTDNVLIYGIVFVIAISIISPGFMTRPQVVTFLFVCIYLFVFHLFFERRKNLLWLLPPIMILWVNMHGGFLIGAGMLPVVLLSELFFGELKERKRRYFLTLLFWFILTEVAILANPYGYRLLVFLYKTLSLPRNISEWESINLLNLDYLRFKLFALSVLLVLFIRTGEKRCWEISIIFISLIFALRTQRHTPIFAIVAAPHLVEHLSVIEKKIDILGKVKSFIPSLVLNLFLAVLILYQLAQPLRNYIHYGFHIIVDPRIYPVYAVHFLKKNGFNGNILLPFEWGEYVIWKMHSKSKVSIDGRFRTVYPEEVITAHFDALRSKKGWTELLDKYPSDILLSKRNVFSENMRKDRDDWIYIYSDNLSMIFIKNRGSQERVIEKLKRKKIAYPNEALSLFFP